MSPTFTTYIILIVINIDQLIKFVQSVRGCVTFVTGNDYSLRQSICDKLDTHFQIIPPNLPSEVIKLTINHQDIKNLNDSQFKHLLNLTYLNLDSNKLKFIHPNTFYNLTKLQTLSLRYNFLIISPDSFHPNVIYGFTILKYLNLLENPIGNIPNRFFFPIGKTLKSLILSSNSKQFNLQNESLFGLYKLQLLDLSNNYLENLSELFEKSFNQMQLKELYLYGNPWNCDCYLRWLKIWYLKYGTKLIYSRPFNENLMKNNIETTSQSWSLNEQLNHNNHNSNNDLTILLQPRCKQPESLYGRPIFNSITNNDIESIRTTDFYCLPEIINSQQIFNLIIGTNITLECEFVADPSGIVVWYKDGTRIQSHWPRMFVKQEQGRRFLAKLNIENVQHSDVGNYVCYLDTGYGRVNGSILLKLDSLTNYGDPYYHNGVFYWISKLDTSLVLKYTGIIASCLIILLILMGLLIYFFYGRHSCHLKSKENRKLSNKTLNPNKNTINNQNNNNNCRNKNNSKMERSINEEYNKCGSIKFSCHNNTSSSNHNINDNNNTDQLRLHTSVNSLNEKSTENLSFGLGNEEKLTHSNHIHPSHHHHHLHHHHLHPKQQQQQHSNHSHHMTLVNNQTNTNLTNESGKNLHLITKPENLDNYVAFRILPAVSRTDLNSSCPLHNYTLLQPVSPDSLQINDTNLNLNNEENSNHLILNTISNYENQMTSQSINNELDKNRINVINSSVTTNTQQQQQQQSIDNLNSSIYISCPLHGNLYATLQTKDRKDVLCTENRKHIASVPAGLSTCHEKRNTLPVRKLQLRTPIINDYTKSDKQDSTSLINSQSSDQMCPDKT